MTPSKRWNDVFEELVEIDPYMGNMTPEGIVDELGVLKSLEKKLVKKNKALTEWLKNRAEQEGTNSFKGENYTILITEVMQERFSQERAKAHLSEEQVIDCMHTIEYQKLTIASNKGK